MSQCAFEQVPAVKPQHDREYKGQFIYSLHFLILAILDCQSGSLSQFLK